MRGRAVYIHPYILESSLSHSHSDSRNRRREKRVMGGGRIGAKEERNRKERGKEEKKGNSKKEGRVGVVGPGPPILCFLTLGC